MHNYQKIVWIFFNPTVYMMRSGLYALLTSFGVCFIALNIEQQQSRERSASK